MTNTNTNTLPKSLDRYVAAWAILASWDANIGGKLPSATHIADAIAAMSKPGGKPAVLNQGLRAFALGFRPEGSTDGQRAYASMSGQPHNNVGKLGDALRAAYKSSRLEVGKPYRVTVSGGIVEVTSNKSGHVHFELVERFTAPQPSADATPAPKASKAKGKGKARKTKPAATVAETPAPEGTNEPVNQDPDAVDMATLESLTAPESGDPAHDAPQADAGPLDGNTL